MHSTMVKAPTAIIIGRNEKKEEEVAEAEETRSDKTDSVCKGGESG